MHPVLAGLDPEQLAVATALDGPVVVLAGAGTGKTRAITHRIAHACLTGARDPHAGLAVTFTTRAAGEMRERLAALGVPGFTARTFHSAALSQLRYFWPTAVGGQMPEILPGKAKLVARAASELGLPAAGPMLRDLTAEVEWAASALVLPADYASAAEAAGRPLLAAGSTVVPPADIGRLLAGYAEAKSRANVLDFEDILLVLIAVIADRPDIADQIRRTYRWFTVDEYQDITPVQNHLLRAWLGERQDICVVGDPKQTIYSFAGAQVASLDEFAARWPQATKVRLDRCYRCSPQIVATANSLGRSSMLPGDSGLGNLQLRSQQPKGPRADILACSDDLAEARTVVGRIRSLIDSGVATREIAVLMRTNAASAPLEVALADAHIPYSLQGGERFFSRPEVREAVVRMRGAAASTAAVGGDLVGAVRAVLRAMSWEVDRPVGGGIAAQERWESLAAIGELAVELAGAGATGIGDVVAELERRAELSLAPSAAGVTLATLHSAKGLEWDHVFIVGVAEGLLPISYANTPARVAEEQRLLYVGITRARRGLVLSWAARRGSGGQADSRGRGPSRFLALLRRNATVMGEQGPAIVSGSTPARPGVRERARPPARCRVCGAGLVTAPEATVGRCRTCPGAPDPAVLDRLRVWRLGAAVSSGVPESIVLTDVTLAAVAELLPTDAAALASIPGLGPAKAQRYGAELLELVAAVPDVELPRLPE